MNYTRILICIAVMAVLTYLPRVLPMVALRKKIENRFFQSFLAYIPYGVLAAMTLPDIFTSTSCLISAIAGMLAALLLAWRGKGLLTVALCSALVVLITETILRFCSLL